MPPATTRGVFVTFEGGDGSGKSTQAKALSARLRETGYSVCLTEEPGGTELGRFFWSYFQQRRNRPTAPIAELLFFESARAQHVEEVIRPALVAGSIVLCDRFVDSTFAYQGYGRGIDLADIRACNQIATGGVMPALTLLFDVPVEKGLDRARGQSTKPADAIGAETLAFHRRVRDGFLELAQAEPSRIVVVDADQPESTVTAVAWQHLVKIL